MRVTFDSPELAALNALPAEARLAALKIKGFQWLDLRDDDSVAQALVAIGERPSTLHDVWDLFKEAVRVLRDGR